MMNAPQMLLRGFLRTILMRLFRVLIVIALILWAITALQPRPEDPFTKVVRGIKPAVALVVVHVKSKPQPGDKRTDAASRHVELTANANPAASVRPSASLVPAASANPLASASAASAAPAATASPGAVDGDIEEAYGTAAVVRSNRNASFLLTDAHVIENAESIEVRFDDGRKFGGTVVDRDNVHDAAIIRVDGVRLPVIAMGTSKAVAAGDPIGLAGYPIPDGFEDEHLGTASSVYAGRIASIRVSAFELDLPVIPGESGGPVFDARDGTVIGIAESRFEDERSIGFATPIDDLRPLIDRAK